MDNTRSLRLLLGCALIEVNKHRGLPVTTPVRFTKKQLSAYAQSYPVTAPSCRVVGDEVEAAAAPLRPITAPPVY